MSLPTETSSSSSNDDEQKIISENIDQQQRQKQREQLENINNNNNDNKKESVIESVVNTSIGKTSLPLNNNENNNNNNDECNNKNVASNNNNTKQKSTTTTITLMDLETSLANCKKINLPKTSLDNNNNNNEIRQIITKKDLSIELNRIANESSTTTSSSSSSTTSTTINKTNSTNNLSSQEYHLKWIKWKGGNSNNNNNNNNSNVNIINNNNNKNDNNGKLQQQQQNQKVPIVTQNSNGSCPLLAIINILLLRKNITFPPLIEIVTASQLMDYLCDCILNYVPKNLPEQVKLNYEQNLQDAMSIMPRLQTGLDVNVKFTGIMDFEYTPECIIFDLLRIPLYHGWLVDPKHCEISRIINNQSYNQLVDKIIGSKANNTNDNEMFLAEEFLNQTASQLTNYGLSQLIRHIKDDELCILFRNNHFITMYKNKGKLYQLVTDQGFLTEPNVVWESLNNIEGDDYFVDADFQLVPPKPLTTLLPQSSSSSSQLPNLNTQQQIDQDYLIALSLEQEQNLELESQQQQQQQQRKTKINNNNNNNNKLKDNKNSNESNEKITIMSDEELARKLQAEEDQYYEEQLRKQQQQQQKQSTTGTLIEKNTKTYASVLSSTSSTTTTTKSSPSLSSQQIKNNLKDGNHLSNHFQISSGGENIQNNNKNLPHNHHHQQQQQSSTNKSTSGTTTNQHSISFSFGHSHPNQQQQPQQQQRSTEQQSMSTPATPTTGSRNMSDDRQSVSSRRSQNKHCKIS